MARLDPHNRVGTGGVDLLSNNFNWSLGLLGLKGRGGLDLGLALSYNSLVWTRSGNYIKYDLDDSTVALGFRLDFPVIEGPYWNDQAGTNFYLMVTPSGARVELRYTSTTNTYESQDSRAPTTSTMMCSRAAVECGHKMMPRMEATRTTTSGKVGPMTMPATHSLPLMARTLTTRLRGR